MIVEHPELVAERVVRLAKVVGRERVIGERGLRICIDAVGQRAAGDRARDRLGQVSEPGGRRPDRQPRAVAREGAAPAHR